MAVQPEGRRAGTSAGIETHRYRQVAESFGSDAERYDRARPGYPGALVERIVAASPGRDVLDVGCGTGIAARQFQAAGCRVLGIDPDARMTELARRKGIEVEVVTFETWDAGGRQFDAVIAAQAWHWVHPVSGAAKAAQVLRPGGRLAVFWNALQPPLELAEAFADVYSRVQTGLPFNPFARPALDSCLMMCGTAAEGIQQGGAFGEPERWRFDWDHVYTRDQWLEQLPTIGGHSLIPPEKLRELVVGIGAAIDIAGGSFAAHYTTVAVTAARTGAG